MLLHHIVSPYGLSLVSTFIFLLAWIFPRQVYSTLVNEPDLMFLDATTLLFFLLCVAGFWTGLLSVDVLFPSAGLLDSPQRPPRIRGIRIILPLLVTTTFVTFAGVKLLQLLPNAWVLILAQQGGSVKTDYADVQLGIAGWGANMHTVVLWWTYWNLIRVSLADRRSMPRRLCFAWIVFAVGLLAQVAVSLLRVSRGELMPCFGGLAVLYMIKKIQSRQMQMGAVLRSGVTFLVTAILMFVLFGMLRSGVDDTAGMGQLVGYTAASYNRLAALLHGVMHYPYGGHGVYLSNAIATNNWINAVVPLRDAFSWPTFLETWNSEFQGVQLAGLNQALIWSGTFGYLFSDFGWFTPLVLAVYGIIYGLVWRSAKSGATLGIALYPWLAFSELLWFSLNMVFDFHFPFFVCAGFVLMAYEKVIGNPIS